MTLNINISAQLPFCHLDDESFKLAVAVFELNHGNAPFDPERLETLLFNPVDGISLILDLDPDKQFCNTSDSGYLTPEQFQFRNGKENYPTTAGMMTTWGHIVTTGFVSITGVKAKQSVTSRKYLKDWYQLTYHTKTN